MGQEGSPPTLSDPPSATEHVAVEDVEKDDVAEEKAVIPQPEDDSKALVLVQKPVETEPAEEVKKPGGSVDRALDMALARVETEKRLSLIKAWEDSEKSRAENKAQRKLSTIGAWENSKKSSLEAELKMIEEKLVKQKAEYVEKMKNKLALIHKSAEDKRAMVEAKKGENLLKAEELAAKYRAKETVPKRRLGIF